MPQMQITKVGPGPHVCWAVPPKASVKIQAVSECIMGHRNTKWYKQCALRVKWRMEGKTHLMELNCVLPVVYESTDAPGTGTWLFTTFAYGKSGKYEDICWEDGRQVRKGAKMISSLSSVGGAEVSAPALRHAQHKEFEYKQKQDLGCLGGRTYVKIEDEGDEEPPCAMPGPRKKSKLEHEQKAGQVG